jgi:hypothetical protein
MGGNLSRTLGNIVEFLPIVALPKASSGANLHLEKSGEAEEIPRRGNGIERDEEENTEQNGMS